MQAATLVRMANQIATNNEAFPISDSVSRVATHLVTFWTPAMRHELAVYVSAHPEAVDPVVVAALSEQV